MSLLKGHMTHLFILQRLAHSIAIGTKKELPTKMAALFACCATWLIEEKYDVRPVCHAGTLRKYGRFPLK